MKRIFYDNTATFETYHDDVKALLDAGNNVSLVISKKGESKLLQCDIYGVYHVNDYERYVQTGWYDLYTSDNIQHGLTLPDLLKRVVELSLIYWN